MSMGAFTNCPWERQFHACCRAGAEKRFATQADSLTITVGQRVRRGGGEEIWDSLGIQAQEESDGTLMVRVLVFNPDWDEPLQIACIRSRPRDAACLTPIGCNLDHVRL